MPERILIAEDDLYQRAMLAGHLAEMDCDIVQAGDAAGATRQLREYGGAEQLSLAIVSTALRTASGVPLFREILRGHPDLPVVLISDRGTMGEATLAMREGVYDYLTKPFESLDNVGLRVSRALERAQLVRENREFRLHISHDLEIARSTQQRFLPQSFPFPGRLEFGAHYTACAVVGGDLYDAFQLDENHAGAYVLDVAGHGASAALVTAMLKISLGAFLENDGRKLCRGAEPTRAVMNHINPVLRRLTVAGQFATLLYAVLDLQRGMLGYTSAGHCPPIFVPPGGAPQMLHPRQGVPVGVSDHTAYFQDFQEFPTGSLLLLYTDGVVEAYDTQRESWGLDNLLRSIANRIRRGPQEIVNGIIADLDVFTRNVPRSDDVTILAFRFAA